MASCRHVEIWKTPSSCSRSPIRFGDVKADRKLIEVFGEGDKSLYGLRAVSDPFLHVPSGNDGSVSLSACRLPDLEQRHLKPRAAEIDLIQVRVPDEVPTSGSNGVSSCSDGRRMANVYVDEPSSSPAAVTSGAECDSSTRADDVKLYVQSSAHHPCEGR